MTNFIAITLGLMPWVCIPLQGITNQFRLPQAMWMDIIFMGIITIGIWKGLDKTYKNKWLSMLSVWVFINIFWNFIMPFYIERKGARQLNGWCLEPMVHFTLGLIATFIVMSSHIKWERIAKAICLSSILISLFSILQYVQFSPWGVLATYSCSNTISAMLDNPNLVGNYLALSLPLFFLLPNKLRRYVGICLVTIGLYVTQSEIAWACALIGLLSYVVLILHKRVAYLLVGLILVSFISAVAYMVNHYPNMLHDRWTCWLICFDNLMRINPVFGIGLGRFRMLNIIIASPLGGLTAWTETHNDYLQYIVEGGLVLVGLGMAYIVSVFKKASIDNFGRAFGAVLVTFLAMMMVSFPIEVPSLAMIGLVSLWRVGST